MNKKTWILVLVVFAAWTVNGLVAAVDLMSMRNASGEYLSFAYAAKLSLSGAWMWVPFALFLLWLVPRFPIEQGRIVSSVLVLTVAVLAVVSARAVLIYALNPWFLWYDEQPAFQAVLIRSLVNNQFQSWLIIGVGHALLFSQRARERERQATVLQSQLADARLAALASRLNPHFLFNALNSIAELVHRDAVAADRMIVGLSALLRSSLEKTAAQEVALQEELRLVGYYLDIEKIRLGERLRVQWQVDSDTLAAQVPPLLLQPLVENAVRHGISRRLTPGLLVVRAHHASGRLVLEVQDDGGASTAASPGCGTGLQTTRARLEHLYGDDFRFELQRDEHERTVVRLEIPFKSLLAVA